MSTQKQPKTVIIQSYIFAMTVDTLPVPINITVTDERTPQENSIAYYSIENNLIQSKLKPCKRESLSLNATHVHGARGGKRSTTREYSTCAGLWN